ncbi:hypothetical protein HDE69_002017 [Pedobacter cryoconitis]|uniref:Uncharacterized protein n=1 Tax=Pedobacter cryoconitis TaxID=188932 RepID=A0A7W9DJQ4_9SPHI|nr:hypothetical protein [Pedobacter cryoconitis]MBB5620964.1 hypothetical protein [Pedobacter cryoconitis]
MSTNNKTTSKPVASKASEILKDPTSSQIAKQLAGSALSQRTSGNQTSREMEDKAARVLASNKYSEETKTLAASVLAQSNKER